MDDIERLRADLEALKEQCDEEEKRKARTTLEKLDADDLLKEAEKRIEKLGEKLSETKETLSEKKNFYNKEMQELQSEKNELTRNIDELNCKVEEYRKICGKMKKDLKVDNMLPHKNINYTTEESGRENLSDISYTCQIVIQSPYILKGGQALLTFEDEKVAQGIIHRGRHRVGFNNGYEDVGAHKVELGRTVKFEVNMTISSTKVNVFNLPIDLPEDILKDKLELAFYKSNIGGGEIESVEYNRNNKCACITYKEDGVAQRVLKTTEQVFTVGPSQYEVTIAPAIEEQLNKLQIFAGVCLKTVLLAEIRNQTDSEDDIKDLVEIHFQKESNGGGEVLCSDYASQSKMAYFEEDIV
ncbi:N-myc-interactor isoform X2 [Hyla sarda]|nr:N-myc-interactor isoform X2 [Hyla sarda]